MSIMKISGYRRPSSVALGAGLLSIMVNTSMLFIADRLGLVTARGGLLKLLTKFGLPWVALLGNGQIADWLEVFTKNYAFQFGFHIVIGMLMAFFVVVFFANYISRCPWRVGLASALFVWLVNAAIVLPLLGEGFAGWRDLTALGITYFAIAHTTFFMILTLSAKRWMAV